MIVLTCPSYAAKKFSDRPFKLRLWGLYSFINYNSESYLTGQNLWAHLTGLEGKIEIEKIPSRKNFAVLVDAQSIRGAKLGDKAFSYTNGSILLTWWLSRAKNEFKFGIGPTIELFPEVRRLNSGDSFSRKTPNLIGVKISAHACVVVGKASCLEISGYWINPLDFYRTEGGTLSVKDSRSYSSTILYDFLLSNSLSFGFGFTHERHRLSYILAGNVRQTSDFRNNAPTVTLQIRL